MSPPHDHTNDNCACESCFYKNNFEAPLIRRLVTEGSRIDKLYFGKYIPLRERQLLNKLIRTRAVYDDIRNQLLSESEISIEQKPHLKPKRHETRSKDIRKTISSTIFQIVDMVNQGNIPKGPEDRNEYECCSCCICGSKTIHLHHEDQRRLTGAMNGSGKKIRQRIGESISRPSVMVRRNLGKVKRGVHARAKSVMSEPLKLSKDIKRRSQDMVRRLHPRVQSGEQMIIEGILSKKYSKEKLKRKQQVSQKEHKNKSGMSKFHEKIKMSKSKIIEPRIRTLKKHIKTKAKKSIAKIKENQYKINEKFKTAAEKSLQKFVVPRHKISAAEISKSIEITRSFDRNEWECTDDECVKIINVRNKNKQHAKMAVGTKSSLSETDDQGQNTIYKTREIKERHKSLPRGKYLMINKKSQKYEPKKKKGPESGFTIEIGSKKKNVGIKSKLVASHQISEPEIKYPQIEQDKMSTSVGLQRRNPHLADNNKVEQNFTPETNKDRQAVKISSSFDFNIEFHKNTERPKHTSHKIYNQRKERSNKADRNFDQRSRASQLYDKKKDAKIGSHALKRCYCTLKLKGKGYRPELRTSLSTTSESQSQTRKINNNSLKQSMLGQGIVAKNITRSTSTLISGSDIGARRKLYLSPHECKPGVCRPKDCDPYICLELINKRLVQRSHKYSNTELNRSKKIQPITYRRTKSTVSMISKSRPNKVKAVQSTITPSERKEKYKKRKLPVIIQSSNQNRQVVRIGSSFSFNIEFYKNKSPTSRTALDVPLRPHLESSKAGSKIHFQGIGGNKIKKHQKSNSVLVKKRARGSFISPMKRCFCTLKLQTEQVKQKKEIETTTVGTGNVTKMGNAIEAKNVLHTKSTKTKKHKRKYDHVLEPYECEPGTCVPGECDPYKCLRRIQRRKLKESSAGTDKAKQRSIRITTLNKRLKSKSVLAQSKLRGQRVSTVKSNITGSVSSPEEELKRQAVRIGSRFSFNVEFSKQRSVALKNDLVSKEINLKPKNKIRHIIVESKNTSSSHRSTQAAPTKAHKINEIQPMLKRCFCTLKLQGKPTKTEEDIKFPNEIAVNRLIVTETNIKAKQTSSLSGNNIIKQNRSMTSLSKSSIVYRYNEMQSYFKTSSIKSKKLSNNNLNTVYSQKYTYSENCIVCCKNNENHHLRKPFRIKNCYEMCLKKYQSCIFTKAQDKYPCVAQLHGQKYYAMNVQIPRRNKLKSYECEPGFCVPGECDPLHCQKLIQQRVIKSRKAGTETMSKTMSSATDQSTKISKEVKLGQVPKKMKKVPAGGITFQTLPRRNQKQAVRIGSSFNFNIEFSTDRSAPTEYVAPLEIKQRKERAIKGYEINHRNQDSQIGIETISKGSGMKVKPVLQRCFCTLKLQKKGKRKRQQEKVARMAFDRGTTTPVKTLKEFVNSRTLMNTGQNTTIRRPLSSYECEPLFCVPGNCNPYECLERIKERSKILKDLTTGTMEYKTSIGSMTDPGQRRTQGEQAHSKDDYTPKTNNENIPSQIKIFDQKRAPQQVVRIGSSFNFNIEFYKDRSPNTEEVQSAAKAIRNKQPQPKLRSVQKKHKIANRATVDSNDVFNQKSQVIKARTQDRGSLVGSFLKRCFCTMKINNQKRSSPHLQLSSQGTQALEEVTSLQNRSVGIRKRLIPCQRELGVCVSDKCNPYKCGKLLNNRVLKESGVMATRPEKQYGYKLSPYECEPGVCDPGECDPYVCKKRIQLRNVEQRELGTSTKRHKRKSVSSEFYSPVYKARKVQRKFRDGGMKLRSLYTESSIPSSPRKSIDLSTTKSVRLSSGFNFKVEFHKTKPNVDEPNMEPMQYGTKLMHPNLSLTKTKNRNMQIHRQIRDIDSQIDAHKMRDAGVNPFLKRCFCTLKLRKSGDGVSSHRIISRAARNQNVYLATLLPYECEPGVCIPGNCDPLECQKRIQRRLIRSQRTGTKRTSQDSSTNPFAGPKFKNSPCQSPVCPANQRTEKAINPKALEEYRGHTPVYSANSCRQAIRLGSSFKFGLEFYKDTCPKFESPRNENNTFPKIHAHNTKTTPKYKNKKRTSTASTDLRYLNNQMQTSGPTESKSTEYGHLKRCFCTLALHKNHEEPTRITKSTFRNDDLSDLYAFSRNVGAATHKRRPSLLPYECEPGVCVPGSCDPYECYERIKRRVKDSGTATVSPTRNYASSITSRKAKYRCTNTQCMKDAPRKERPTMANFNGRVPRFSRTPKISECNDRQAVRIGSNFNFSIEFYKDRPNVKLPKAVYKIKDLKPEQKLNKLYKDNSKQRYYKNRKSYAGKPGLDQKCQAECVKNTSKGTSMGVFLKRCFCTLNLYKNNKPETKKEFPKNQPKQKPIDINRVAMVQTRDKYTNKIKGYSLKPYECEPNVCVPGECSPYDCEERIKRRNRRRHSRKLGTHRRSSQITVGSMTSRLVPRTDRHLQYSERRARHASRPSQGPKFVEEPRFPHMLENIRTGIKIGSNMNFDLEFYKDKTPYPTLDDQKKYENLSPKAIKVGHRDVNRKSTFSETYPASEHRGVGEKCKKYNCETQANNTIKKDRAVGVNNMLKRCFCTLKLQKQPKVVTVNRLSVDNPNQMVFKPTKPLGNNQLKLKNNLNVWASKKKKYSYKNEHYNRAQNYVIPEGKRSINASPGDYKEMTTIYPYIPKKFKRYISKTILLQNLYTDKIPAKRCLLNKPSKKKKKKHFNVSFQNSNLPKEPNVIHKRKSHLFKIANIKSFLRRIIQLNLLRQQKKSSGSDEQNGGIDSKKSHKNEMSLKTTKQGLLKTSKSDGQPIKTTSPKKTNSLKLTKASQKTKAYRVHMKCNQDTKKIYSRYQSGDSTETYSNVIHHRAQNCCNNDACHIESNKNKINHKSPYDSTKIIQMSFVKNRRNLKNMQYMNPKINTRSLGVVTRDPTKANRWCPCPRDTKSRLSSGDNNAPIQDIDIHKRGLKRRKRELPGDKTDAKKRNKKIGDNRSRKVDAKKQNVTFVQKQESNINKSKILLDKKIISDLIKGNVSFKNCLQCLNSGLVSSLDCLENKIRHLKNKASGGNTAIDKDKLEGAKLTIKGKRKGGKSKGPCVCGSTICEKERMKMQKFKETRTWKQPPCVCGSSPCARESKKERKERKLLEQFQKNIVCVCEAEIKRQQELAQKKIHDEKKRKEEEKRVWKKYKEQDEKRKKERIKQDKLKAKEIKKMEKSGDAALMAESLLDIMKLGFTASGDVLRCTKRAIVHPKRTAANVKDFLSAPSRALLSVGNAVSNSGIVSTIQRVKTRCKTMRRYKKIKNRLESNPFTRYLMYCCSKDAKKRIGKAKARRRQKEPIDFECSLFMASLRRRPCLAVYYTCPWFYPHCLSILNLWKQFTDIMLVLVAVAVWSPCVVLAEVCRAAMCCFFCTG